MQQIFSQIHYSSKTPLLMDISITVYLLVLQCINYSSTQAYLESDNLTAVNCSGGLGPSSTTRENILK